MKKIKNIKNLSQEEIESGANYYNTKTDKARIDGDKYPMWYAKLINKLRAGKMPFVIFVGDPSTGKTYAASKLNYDLTHEIGFLTGEFTPDENIHYDNIPFLKAVHDSRKQALHKPEINTTLHALDYNDKGNREFEKMLNLARIYGNLITGDAQKLYRCDRAIRENHTFRLVAAGGEDEYWFDVYYIERRGDSEKKDVKNHFLHRWKPEKPPEELCEYIEDKDEEWKGEALEEGIKELEKEKKEEEKESISLA